MRLAVVGDIHANAGALNGALALADSSGYDMLILLGDLLTYGTDVEATLQLVLARQARGNTILLRGNHDALYQELLGGHSEYLRQLPGWLRESVEWTAARLPRPLWHALKLCDEYQLEELLFSHANPFGAGHWEYLNSEAQHLSAASALASRSLRAGIFGHTHRTRWFRCVAGRGEFLRPQSGNLDRQATHVLNAGAVGQPRDRADLSPHVLWMVRQMTGGDFQVAYQDYSYDTAEHLRALERSGMSAGSVARISRYFMPDDTSDAAFAEPPAVDAGANAMGLPASEKVR